MVSINSSWHFPPSILPAHWDCLSTNSQIQEHVLRSESLKAIGTPWHMALESRLSSELGGLNQFEPVIFIRNLNRKHFCRKAFYRVEYHIYTLFKIIQSWRRKHPQAPGVSMCQVLRQVFGGKHGELPD